VASQYSAVAAASTIVGGLVRRALCASLVAPLLLLLMEKLRADFCVAKCVQMPLLPSSLPPPFLKSVNVFNRERPGRRRGRGSN